MTDQERALLLTVARILRARILETRVSKNDDCDLFDLSHALYPFDPKHGDVVANSGAVSFSADGNIV